MSLLSVIGAALSLVGILLVVWALRSRRAFNRKLAALERDAASPSAATRIAAIRELEQQADPGWRRMKRRAFRE